MSFTVARTWGVGSGEWGIRSWESGVVGWVERSETQKRIDNVGFRPSTQPTPVLVFMLN